MANWQGGNLTNDDLFRLVVLSAGKFIHLPVGQARFGLRHAALNALALGRFKRGLLLAEAATRLPLELVMNLTPAGRVVGEGEIEEIYQTVKDLFEEISPLPDPCPNMVHCPHKRPWRALLTVIEAYPYPDETRRLLLRKTAALDETGAWVGQTFLRLAARTDLGAEAVGRGALALILGWTRFIDRNKARWFPTLYDAKVRVAEER